MYLVHAYLRPPAALVRLPHAVADLLLAHTWPGDCVEHISLHPLAVPVPVLGVWSRADSVAEAEEHIAALCSRVLAAAPQLRGWLVTGVSALPLAPSGQVRFGPADSPSTHPDQ